MAEENKDKDLLLEKIKVEVKQLVDDSIKENVKKSDLDSKVEKLNKDIEQLSNKGREELKNAVDDLTKKYNESQEILLKQGRELATIKDYKPTKAERKTFRQALEDAFMEKKELFTEKNDDYGKRLSLKEYFDTNKNAVFTIKAVDMLESNIVQSSVSTVRLTELDPQRVGIPLTIYPHVMQWMPSKGISKPYMSVLIAYSYSDGAGTKTEGSASGQSSFLFKTVEFKSFYIATYGTLSDETLDDLPEALDEISMVFPDKIMDNVDGQILGAAGDDSTALAGLFTANKHTDYAGTAYAGNVPGANMIDLIDIMAAEVKANKYIPDAVIMNPQERIKLGQLKDLLNNSISDRRISFDTLGRPVFVSGLRIFESTGITADTMAVVDSRQLLIGKRKEMTVEIGYNAADLTEGQKTVVVKVRVAFAVRDKAAVIYSDSVETDWNALIKV